MDLFSFLQGLFGSKASTQHTWQSHTTTGQPTAQTGGNHSDSSWVSIDSWDGRKPLRHKQKVWRNTRDGFITADHQQLVEVDGVVVEPSQVKARCVVCGQLTDKVIRCAISGDTLCRRHSRKICTGTGEAIILRIDYAMQFSDTFDTWAALDGSGENGGNKELRSPTPMAIAD